MAQRAEAAIVSQTEEGFDFTIEERLFRVSEAGMESPPFEMPAAHWLQPAKALEALEAGGAMSKAIGMKMPVSYAGLSVLNLVLVKLLFLVRHDRWLDLSLDDLTFQMEKRYETMQTGYRIDTLHWTALPERADIREDFLEQQWRRYLRTHIRPAIDTIAVSAGLKPDLIWNQAGGRLAGIREYLHQYEPAADEEFLARYDWHANVLIRRLTAEDYARRRNPFDWQPRFTDNPWKPGGRMMIRSSCCMYDCREGGQRCYNCPQMTTAERDIRRAAVLAEAAT